MSDRHLRILFISSEFPPGPGGIGNHAFHIVEELRKNGCELTVVAPQEFATQAEIERFNQTQLFTIRSINYKLRKLRKAWVWRLEIMRAIEANKPIVIIGSGARAVWLAALASRLHKIPLIAIGHGSEFGGPVTAARRITRRAFNLADAVVYVSGFTQLVARDLGIHPRRDQVIHNGANAALYSTIDHNAKQRWSQTLGFSEADPILLTVGSLTRRKGQEIAIRALPGLLKEFPHLRYLMAGLPTEKAMLDRLVAQLGVAKNAYFLGNIASADLPGLYQACDIFVMTSQRLEDGDFEGFGISVIEAALSGKPAVVSGDSGLAEAVVHGETGICVPEKDPAGTALAIKQLLMDIETRRTMGEKAKTRAMAELTWEKVGAEYWQLVQTVVGCE
jgi:phosphatidylinositol alpha-1,6-mannosyltransferase